MSTKASITAGSDHHLYFEEFLDDAPRNVFLELTNPREFSIARDYFHGKTTENLIVEIPSEVMDDIAIAWIKKRGLQGAVGGPVGAEFGGPDCPWD